MAPRGGSYREIHSLPHDFEDGRTECHHLIPADCLQAVGIDPHTTSGATHSSAII